MSQEMKRRATRKAPRTQIEDLPHPVEELSEDEASQAAGGLVVNNIIGVLAVPLTNPAVQAVRQGGATQAENTCTAGNALQGSDSDYGSDIA